MARPRLLFVVACVVMIGSASVVLADEDSSLPAFNNPSPPPTDAAGDVFTSWSPGVVPWGIAYDVANDTVWVSSPGPNWGGNNTLTEFTTAGVPTGRSHTYPWAPANGPADLAYNFWTGRIWVMNINTGVSNCLYEMDPVSGFTGVTICPGGPTGWATSQRGLAYDPVSDTFYAGSWNDVTIYHIDSSGNDVEPPVNVGLSISGLAYNPDSRYLYVMVNASPNTVTVLDTSAAYAVVGQFAMSAGFGDFSGAGLGIACTGDLWAVDQDLDMVAGIDSADPTTYCSLVFVDGFESGTTGAWSGP